MDVLGKRSRVDDPDEVRAWAPTVFTISLTKPLSGTGSAELNGERRPKMTNARANRFLMSDMYKLARKYNHAQKSKWRAK